MTPQPITITFLSRTHEIPAYDAEGIEYRQDCGNGLELRVYRLNRGWMARLDVAAFDTYTQSQRHETAEEAVREIEDAIRPLGIGRSLDHQETQQAHSIIGGLVAAIEEGSDPRHLYREAEAWLNRSSSWLAPVCDEPTVEMSREMLAEALQGG